MYLPDVTRNYQQRKYLPKNPLKYQGDPTQIFMRSSWETRFAIWCDDNPSILEWSSETTVIPYRSPIDNCFHRYFVDFWIKVKNKKGIIDTYLVEIKPRSQCLPPRETPHKRKRTLLEEQTTFLINQAKWESARAFAAKRGWKFIVITEVELGLTHAS